jgi:hypothetical protein
MTEKKMTLRQYYNTILTLVEDNEELTAMTQERINQLDRKNSTAAKKTNELAENNNTLREEILNEMEIGRGYTITDMIKEIPACAELTQSKVTSLVKGLIESGKVVKTTEKRRSIHTRIS